MKSLLKIIKIPFNGIKLLALFLAVPSKKVLSFLLIISTLSILVLLLQLRYADKRIHDLQEQNSGLIDEVGQTTEQQTLLQQELQLLKQDTSLLKSYLGITPSPDIKE